MRPSFVTPAALLAACLFASGSQASSPLEWEAHQQAVAETCRHESRLQGAKVVGAPAVFPDKVGYTAMRIEGRSPQARQRGRTVQVLCLYDRRSRDAHIEEWQAGPEPKR